MTTRYKRILLSRIREQAIRRAPEGETFTLKNGGLTTWYIDLRPITYGDPMLVGSALNEAFVEHIGWDNLPEPQQVVIGGPAVGATALAVAFAMEAGARSFTIRSEPKDHGASGDDLWVGAKSQEQDKILMVEDVFTTGGSLLRAVDAVHEHYAQNSISAEIIGAVVLVNRAPKSSPYYGVDMIQNIPLISLFTPEDLNVEEDE